MTASDKLHTKPPTSRAEQKAQRRVALLEVAKRLFAHHGFHGVRLEDLGSGAGISGPAVYRHFASKEAVLAELLIGISEYLHSGGRAVVDRAPDASSALAGLVAFHVEFAMTEPDLIRIQDRDFAALPDDARKEVRRLQREYVDMWSAVLRRARPELSESAATVTVQSVFGMINSTPHLARKIDPGLVAATLSATAEAALGLA